MKFSFMLNFYLNRIGVIMVVLAFGAAPAVAYTPPETDNILIDTARADFGAPGVHIGGKPPGPASINWRESNPKVSIGGALYLDSFMVSTGCAKLVVEFFNMEGSRISPSFKTYDYLTNKRTEETRSTWDSDCLSNAGAIANMIVWQKRLVIYSEDSRIYTVRLRTKYCCEIGNYNWVESKRYCSDRDGVNGYRVC